MQQTANTVLSVKYAPEIRNASSCFWDGHHVRCMCIVDSNPPSEVRLLSDRELLNTRTEQFGLLTIVTLEADLGLSSSVKCIAYNTMGNATLLMSLPHCHIYIYIGVSIGVALLLLSILLLVVARKYSQIRCDNESAIEHNHDLGLGNPQYAVPMRSKCADVHYSDHTYGNEEIFDPEDDALYANVRH
ncbi:myelin-associated glycoprotein-like [Periophthalmus magnuspinnatus]|uniref:myelin-associated glycoprotein-like n=1 Tax=Periophthalmus magnuspinnatus TaxID=409849 RepID=UPI0024373545|nr:myelin-associated glycoprotein-like [Periophthalmus magnuspinnatus]